jgi:hypothetical protein
MLAMNGFGGEPVPQHTVVVLWSIPVLRSFTGLSSPFIRAAPSCGVAKLFWSQTSLLLFEMHGPLTHYLLSMQTLRVSWGPLLIPSLLIDGPS